MVPGPSWRTDHIPWTRPTCLLSCAQSQIITSVLSHMIGVIDVSYVSISQLGVRQYVCCLEQSVISSLAHFDLQGYTTDETGVWINNYDGIPNKICAIGMWVPLGSLSNPTVYTWPQLARVTIQWSLKLGIGQFRCAL